MISPSRITDLEHKKDSRYWTHFHSHLSPNTDILQHELSDP